MERESFTWLQPRFSRVNGENDLLREWLTVHLGGQNLFLLAPRATTCPCHPRNCIVAREQRHLVYGKKKPFVLSSISYDRFRNDVKSPPRFDQSIRNNWKFTRSEVPSKGNYFRARLLFDSGYQVSRYFLRHFEIKIRIRKEKRDL